MLHIDGNHDIKYVLKDIELFLPLLNPNSIIVMEDIDWNSVKSDYKKLKNCNNHFWISYISKIINNKIRDENKNKYEFEHKNIYDLIEVFNEKFNLYKQNSLLEGKNSVNYLEELNMEIKAYVYFIMRIWIWNLLSRYVKYSKTLIELIIRHDSSKTMYILLCSFLVRIKIILFQQ